MAEDDMAATTTRAKRAKAPPKVRFLIALPPALFRQIEKRAFTKKQRLGTPWFRNDEVIDLLQQAVNGNGEGKTPPTV